MWMFYGFMMYVFVLGIRISALWNHKSKQWVQGRKHWVDKINNLPKKSEFRIWFHVSSLGEFEQARPVIERIKELRPETEIILTFFSPSGYEMKHNYELASVMYLPADLPGNAAKWLDIVDPDFAVFVKYDLWPSYLKSLLKKQIPSILISAHWLPDQGFNSWSNPLTINLLKNFKMIFLQRDEYLETFKSKGFKNIKVAGDTRIDRTLRLPEEVQNKIPKELLNLDRFDIVAGSTWPADEELLIEAITKLNLKAIIAPHDVSISNIDRLFEKIKVPAVRFSELKFNIGDIKVIVIDSIGLLSVLYALGNIAYIGGGFGKGIHNSLEAMAHGKPLIFGPHYQKFPEAVDMVALRGAWSIKNEHDLILILDQLRIPGKAEEAGEIAKQYLKAHSGATDIVTDYILKSIPYIA